MVCMSCKGQKSGLRKRKSKLMGTDLFLCAVCYEKKYEPRYAVILSARSHGINYVEDWIKNKRYVGEEITIRELL